MLLTEMQDAGGVPTVMFIVGKVNGQWNYPMAYVHSHRCLKLFNKTSDERLNFLFQRKDLKGGLNEVFATIFRGRLPGSKIYVSSISWLRHKP